MEAFVDAYFAIDTGRNGRITIPELKRYMVRNNYDESFMRKWINLFDSQGTGVITLEEYCDVLGLNAKTIKQQRGWSASMTVSGGLPSDVILISSDMELSIQLTVVEICREAVRIQGHEKDMVKFIKQTLDQRVEKLWHCVMVVGQFWCWYSHQPGYSFIFRMGKYIFIIWKTPFM